MIQKGTFRPLKKILGGSLIALAFGMFFDLEILIQIGKPILAVIIGISGYFLFISGRQL